MERGIGIRRSKLSFVGAGLLAILSWSGHAWAVIVPDQFPTIQSAVRAVIDGRLPDGTVIEVRAGSYGERVAIDGTPKSMTIRSISGPGSTMIDAGGTGSTVLIRGASGAIRIEGFTITGGVGVPGQGGGLAIDASSPVIVNSVIRANRATPDNGGGAVITRSTPTFVGSTFEDNVADRFGGGLFITQGSNVRFEGGVIRRNRSGAAAPDGAGGGVFIVDASATMIGTSILDNRSVFASGGIHLQGVFGSPNGLSLLIMRNCDVLRNLTRRADPGRAAALGGGIHVEDNARLRLLESRVTGNVANSGAGLNSFRGRIEVIDSVVSDNDADDAQASGGFGGGITGAVGATLILRRSAVRDNIARVGGGIYLAGDPADRSTLIVARSVISDNTATAGPGGGILAARSDVDITGTEILLNEVTGNAAPSGGGIQFLGASVGTIVNTTIASNSVPGFGGGVHMVEGSAVDILDSRIYDNFAGSNVGGGGIFVGAAGGAVSGTIQNNVIADNENWQIGETDRSSSNVIYVDNEIRNDPTNDIYVSHTGPGSQFTSIGNFNAHERADGNTSPVPTFASFRAAPPSSRAVLAWSVARATSITVRPVGGSVISTAAPTGTVEVNEPCRTTYRLTANRSVGSEGPFDLVVDGNPCNPDEVGIVTGNGPGGGPNVRVWSVTPATGNADVFQNFMAYDPGFDGGVTVAGHRSSNSLFVVTAPGPGGGPHVRIWDVSAPNVPSVVGEFFPYNPAFRGGVLVAMGDVTGDGIADVITAPARGGGPHVRVFDISDPADPADLGGFFAYNPAFRGGVFVAAGDVDGDGIDEIITGTGGGGPHVKVFRGPAGNFDELGSFFAYSTSFRGGATVAAGDLDGDGRDEIITGTGTGGGPHVKIFEHTGGGFPALGPGFFAYAKSLRAGVRVAAGNVDGDAFLEVITAPGEGAGPHVRAFDVAANGAASATGVSYLAYPAGFQGGVFVGGYPPP